MMKESDYVSFQLACAILAEKQTATREEVTLWAWLGKRCGGIAAYSSPRPSTCSKADGCDSFKPEHCGSFAPSPQYAHIRDDLEEHATPWGWLTDAYFLRREVESFNPSQVGRYISWGDLLARWGAYGLTESDVLSKVRGRIHDDELTDLAPILGGTEIGSETGAPASWAMFPLADIKAIEARDFPGNAGNAARVSVGGTAKAKGGRKPGPAREVLRRILDALEEWAAAADEPFDRWRMPGPLGKKADDANSFHWLCAKIDPLVFTKATTTFEKHRAGLCAIAEYAKPSDFYRRALPHIAPKFASGNSVSKIPVKRRKAA